MKGERIKRRREREKKANRKALLQVVLAVTVGPGLLVWFALSIVPTGSPSNMVKAQVVKAKPKPVGSQMMPTNSTHETIVTGGKQYVSVPFSELAAFDFKVTPEMADAGTNATGDSVLTQEQIPGSIEALNEQHVAITGFMLPVKLAGKATTEFLLLRNQAACCYGMTPRINEWVIVRAGDKGVRPVMDVPITIEGTFHVGDVREQGQLTAIYELDCDQLLNPRSNR